MTVPPEDCFVGFQPPRNDSLADGPLNLITDYCPLIDLLLTIYAFPPPLTLYPKTPPQTHLLPLSSPLRYGKYDFLPKNPKTIETQNVLAYNQSTT
jgi:hypothetical protein